MAPMTFLLASFSNLTIPVIQRESSSLDPFSHTECLPSGVKEGAEVWNPVARFLIYLLKSGNINGKTHIDFGPLEEAADCLV